MSKPNTNISGLRRILQQELLLGKQLVALAEEESEVIIRGDVSRLAALEMEQRHCVEEQTGLENARMTATRTLAFALGMERIPTLSGLLPALPARDQDVISQLRVQLLETQGRLDSLNVRNRGLLENALEYVRFSLDALTTATLQPARYGVNLACVAAPAFYIDSKA